MLQANEPLARKVAYIIGPSSAAAEALAELERRREAGEDAEIFYVVGGSGWIVGPRPAASIGAGLKESPRG